MKLNGGNSALHLAVMCRDLQSVKELINNGADYNMRNDCRQTPLNLAFDKEYYEIATYLIQMGAAEDASPPNSPRKRKKSFFKKIIFKENR